MTTFPFGQSDTRRSLMLPYFWLEQNQTLHIDDKIASVFYPTQSGTSKECLELE